jgi:hypothetical protein
MHYCETCNYGTNKLSNFKCHIKSIKHINNVNNNTNDILINNLFICYNCNRQYKYNSSLYKHSKKCKNANKDLEIERLNKDLEIERLKNELLKKDIEIKSIVNNVNYSHNSNNNIQNADKIVNITNVKNISKIENLNINFGDVIDINTFIENYKNQYGLTNKQTEVLLINYKENGINSCISSLVYYLKESAIQQYKELKGKEITMANIILPFILSDKYLRDHFEKTINGNWDKTTVIDNIKRIVGITDDHVFKHQKTYMHLSDAQKKKLVNGLLKASGYSKLALISNPDLYKNENNSSGE